MNWGPLPADQVTVAQVLQQAGFSTAAVVDTPFYVRNGMNYDRGFSSFLEITGQFYWQKKAGLTAEKVRKAHANYCGEGSTAACSAS